MLGHSLAVCAGLCAAVGSVCAKLAFSPQLLASGCVWGAARLGLSSHLCSQVSLALQVLFFTLIFTSNGLMWTLFVRSLQACSSSLQATVINTASNFFFSALCGWLLFGESLRLLWWIGASFIVMGLVLINYSQPAPQKSKQN